MWSMPVVLTETENENDSANQNYAANMTLKNDVAGVPGMRYLCNGIF